MEHGAGVCLSVSTSVDDIARSASAHCKEWVPAENGPRQQILTNSLLYSKGHNRFCDSKIEGTKNYHYKGYNP